MPVFDSNCLYIIKCLALVFVVAPCVLFTGGMLICGLMWCGLRITRALNLRMMGLPRCGRCRYWATVQCPLYGHSTPDDAGGADCGGEDADEEPEIYRPIPMEHTHGGED